MKRVALVRPPDCLVLGSLTIHGTVPPLGLAYIASAARAAGHRVQVIDAPGEALDQFVAVGPSKPGLYLHGLTADEVLDRIEPGTEVLGITHMFMHEWPYIREIAEKFRARFPQAAVVLGGDNATSCWEQIFEESSAIDYVVVGEGEATFVELLQVIGQHPVGALAGVVSRQTPAASAAVLPRRLHDLDGLPRPAWDLFPVESYLQRASDFGVNRGRSMPIVASRGCPYQCTFCPAPQMWTTRYLMRSPADVVDEIEEHVRRYAVDNVDFSDLTAIVRRDWILEFCRIMQERAVRISWQLPVGTRSEALDDEVLRAIYRAGCRNLGYAPESGSGRMLRIMKKRLDPERLMASMVAASRIGLVVRFHLIVGHPEERFYDLWQSIKYLLRAAVHGIRDAGVFVFVPVPGTEDRERLVEAGVLPRRVADPYMCVAYNGRRVDQSCHPRWSPRLLQAIQVGMLAVFYLVSYCLHPQRIPQKVVRLFRTLTTSREEDQIDKLIGLRVRQLLDIFRHRHLRRR